MLHRVAADIYKLRQMAVSGELQGKGIGKMLVAAAEVFAAQNGYNKIVLHARKVAMGFYHALGYTQAGTEFSEVGIPHYAMEKTLV
jgi:predicted GNAT family N-acyltransferase